MTRAMQHGYLTLQKGMTAKPDETAIIFTVCRLCCSTLTYLYVLYKLIKTRLNLDTGGIYTGLNEFKKIKASAEWNYFC